MKNFCNSAHFPSGKWRKPLRVMKLKLMLLLLCVGTLSANTSFSQQKMNVSFSNEPVISVLNELRVQTGLRFVYMKELIPESKTVTVSMQDATINQILDRVLAGYNYQIQDNVVMITASETAAARQNPPAPRTLRLQGTVKDSDGRPLVGATVRLKNAPKGTISDANGFFVFEFPAEENITIVVSYVGKKNVEIEYEGQLLEQIEMEDSAEAMDELLVTGYQTISKERATGSYGSVTAEEISRKATFDLASTLEGMIAGLYKDPRIGAVTIRGEGTLLTDGHGQPLYVIDGFPVEGEFYRVGNQTVTYSMPNINPNDIESITVLKDAAAASIYGARAGNGVIVITTKKAKKGAAQINFSADLQYTPGADYDYMNYRSASQYLDMQWDFLDKNPRLQDPDQKQAAINSLRNGYSLIPPSLDIMLKYYDGTLGRQEAEAEINKLRSNGMPLLDDYDGSV